MPERKGLVTGIIVAGFGGGAFVFGFIAHGVVNPEGFNIADAGEGKQGYYASDSLVAKRVPEMFIVLGCCYFVLVSLAAMCVSEPSEEEQREAIARMEKNKQLAMLGASAVVSSSSSSHHAGTEASSSSSSSSSLPASTDFVTSPLQLNSSYQAASTVDIDTYEDGQKPHHHHIGVGSGSNIDIATSSGGGAAAVAISLHSVSVDNITGIVGIAKDIGPAELVKVPLAWHLASCFITTTVGGMYLAGTYKTYGQEIFSSEAFLSSVGSTASIFNAVGRIFWGALSDRFGAINTITSLSLIYSVIIGTYAMSPRVGGEFGFTLWTFLIFFFEGGNFALYPPICVQLFGTKNAGSNYGLIFTCYSFCVVANITVLAGYAVSFQVATESMALLTFAGFINLVPTHTRALVYIHTCTYSLHTHSSSLLSLSLINKHAQVMFARHVKSASCKKSS